MSQVKILKRSKMISIRLTFRAMSAMRMAAGNYLYQNPDDEGMAEFYKALPGPDEYIDHYYNWVKAGARNVRFDITQLDCLILCLELVTVGAWPEQGSITNRIEELKQISPLEALGMAAAE